MELLAARAVGEHGPQERDAPFPSPPFGSETGKFTAQLRNLLVEILLRPQPAIAGIGIDAEIADHQRRDGIERERIEERAEPFAGNHAATMTPPALRPL